MCSQSHPPPVLAIQASISYFRAKLFHGSVVPPVDASSYLEDCGTRAYIAMHVGTRLVTSRPPICGVHSICIWTVAKEGREVPALPHPGSRNPRHATHRSGRASSYGASQPRGI